MEVKISHYDWNSPGPIEVDLEDIPNHVIKKTLESKLRYNKCDETGEIDWTYMTAGHNNYDECEHCGKEYTVVG